MTRNRRPVIITNAEPSQDEQLRSRQIRYASMMGIRIVCLIIAGVLVSVQAPMLWLWVPLCVAGMVLLPWMAVLIANDRPPKQQHTLGSVLRRGRRGNSEADQPSVPDRGGDGPPEITAPEARTIDGDA
ncbi:MAG: DUF3099 domain-containing protein [Micromonosporaceae bacterium]